MKEERLLELFGDIDPGYIREAETVEKRNKKSSWVRWGAVAACAGIVAVGILIQRSGPGPEGGVSGAGGSVDAGGQFPEGVDPVTYSVAVYPPSEDVRDVETADIKSLTEVELQDNPLAAWLPGELPEGYHFGRGSLYETVMKNGESYHMLRVEYITGRIPEQKFDEDGGAIVPDLDEMGDQFLVMVRDHKPSSKVKIYEPEEVTLRMVEEGRVVYIRRGDIYVGFCVETADAASVLEAITQ